MVSSCVFASLQDSYALGIAFHVLVNLESRPPSLVSADHFQDDHSQNKVKRIDGRSFSSFVVLVESAPTSNYYPDVVKFRSILSRKIKDRYHYERERESADRRIQFTPVFSLRV